MKIATLLKSLQIFRQIFCHCTCGEVFRLSEAKLVEIKYERKKDWLGVLHSSRDRLERQMEAAEESFQISRQKILLEQQAKAQKQCNKIVDGIIPSFNKLRINSNDVKSIMTPVKFVAFNGLYQKAVREVCFIDTLPISKIEEKNLRSLARTIEAGNFSWSTAKVNDLGYVTIK